jgi:SAM-dependent methyltransferase
MMSNDELAKFYAGYTKKVGVEGEDDLLFGASETEVETLTANQLKFVSTFVAETSRGRVLDVGCGKGAFLKSFNVARPGWTCIGVEPSREEAALARGNAGFEIHEGMFGDEDLGRDAFDLVTVMHVLEHVASPVTVVRRVHDVLRPGGLAFIEVPNFLDSNMFYDLLLLEHLYHFSAETLSWFLQREGFEIRSIDTSTSYGALRVIASKASGARQPASPPGSARIKTGFEHWSRLWKHMSQVCAVGAGHARSGARVGIFGAGMTAAAWLVYSDLFDAPIVGLLDENQWKIGREFFGRRIYALSDLARLDLAVLLVATMPGSQSKVTAKLREQGPTDLEVMSFVD